PDRRRGDTGHGVRHGPRRCRNRGSHPAIGPRAKLRRQPAHGLDPYRQGVSCLEPRARYTRERPLLQQEGLSGYGGQAEGARGNPGGGRSMTWRYSKNKLVPTVNVVPAFITKEPEPDESLVGFIDRTFARTVFANPIAALAHAG